ncbi:hypothetical protein L596_015243 [Steinernema carpocapsae]|uniref:glutathione transferase n=1 Tax=Steinernema carpocapsae TaxID=34508 RepID=A0A4U5NFP6_STECR|nr:hypothetical protein L596_015243 [Steinernema carpocapsae]
MISSARPLFVLRNRSSFALLLFHAIFSHLRILSSDSRSKVLLISSSSPLASPLPRAPFAVSFRSIAWNVLHLVPNSLLFQNIPDDKMPQKYELVYFDIRGLAEMIRLLCADSGIPLVEKRIKTDEEWTKIKKNFVYGQVPCLKDDDVHIVQTGAIIRHLARKHNLYGRDEDDQCHADMFFEGIRDLHSKYTDLIYNNYDTPGKKDAFLASTLPTALGQLEKLFVSRQNGDHFVLGDKICFVDYALFEELDIMLILDRTTLDNSPALRAFHQRMNQRPSLKAYLDKRAADCVKVNWNNKQ